MDDCTTHGMHLDPEVREAALKRMKTVRGHLEGIVRMLEDDSIYCVDVLKQIKAVEGALDRIGGMVLQSHLKHHVVTSHERGDTDTIVAELMEVLKYR